MPVKKTTTRKTKPRAKKAVRPGTKPEAKTETVTKAPPAGPAVDHPKAAGRYIFAVGRRKTAVARVKLFPEGDGGMTINGRTFENYFPTFALQKSVTAPLELTGLLKTGKIAVTVFGGGTVAQAQALSLGISRAILKHDPAQRLVLKKAGLLVRDDRKKERKKPGLKRARRAPQWQKR